MMAPSDHSIYNERLMQRFYLDNRMLPEMTDWEAGQEYQLLIRVKMKGKTENEDGTVEAPFELLTAKPAEDDYQRAMSKEQKRYNELMGS